jgi:small subunit ribosomal protein S8
VREEVTISDPIADMLNRIRNATMVRHDSVLVPASKLKAAIAKILKEEGFIADFEMVKGKPHRVIKIYLRYYTDKNQPAISSMRRVSKPGLRVYVDRTEIPRVSGGLGIAILSTSKGVMTGQQAWRQGMGGELLCYVS